MKQRAAPWACGVALAILWLGVGTQPALPDDHRGTAEWSGDFLSYYLPNAEFLGARLARGALPLWNPQHAAGAPFLAALQAGALYPPNWLHAVVASQTAFTVLAALHLLLACGLAGALARRLGAEPGGACVAGVAYASSLQVVGSIWSPPVLYSAAWLPGLFVGVEAAIVLPRVTTALRLAVVFGLDLLTGWPYGVAIGAVGAAAYGGMRVAGEGFASGRLPWRALVALLAGAAGGLALAAPQLLPAADLLERSCRALGSLVERQAVFVDGPHDPSRFWNALRARGFNDAVPGALALLLAPFALIGRGRTRVGLLLLVGLLGLLASFPEHSPVYGWLRATPVLGDFRFPFRYRILPDLALAMAAGMGVTYLCRRAAAHRLPFWLVPGAVLLLWVPTAIVPVTRSVRPFVREAPRPLRLAEELPAGMQSALPDGRSGRVYWTEWARKLRAQPELAVVHDMEPLTLARLAQLVTFFEGGRPLTVMRIETARGPGRTTGDTVAAPFYGRLGLARGPERAALLDLLSVTRIVTQKPPSWLGRRYERLSPRDLRPIVYANRHALPRVVRVGAAIPEPANPGSALATLANRSFDARRIAMLDLPPPGLRLEPGSAAPPVEGQVEIEDYAPERVSIETRGSRPAVVVLSDSYDPGWVATLDGAEVPLLRANFAFRGVAVPAGTHRVEMRYEPVELPLGLAVAALALLAFAVARVFEFRRAPVECSQNDDVSH